MVQAQVLRDEFTSRLKKALAHRDVPSHGAGAYLCRVTGRTAKAASKWLNAEAIPGIANMKAIASDLGVRLEWLQFGVGPMLAEQEGLPEPGSPHENDYALIPLLTAKGENGNGYLNDHVEVKGGLAFKRDWLARMNAKPEDLSVIYARGDSMEPYIIEGDVVLIDHAATEPINGKVYAIRRPDDSISIKRLVQQLSGDWIITSDNPNKTLYRDEPVGSDSVCQVPIIGRVVWRGGALS